ncbi:hypothetical protein MMC14_002891 [Varicellaria rhodocarpa]|nr:hypothetical protein [Varicellaria rhodocarpa]
MRRLLLWLLFSTFSFFASVTQCQEQNVFINPPAEGQTVDYSSISNPVWIWGTKQVLRWNTTYPLFTLFLWQQPVLNGKDYFYPLVETPPTHHNFKNNTLPANLSNTSQLTWTVGTDLDLTLTNIFCMTIGNGSSTTEYIQSHFFNISWPEGPTTNRTTTNNNTSPSSSTATIIPSPPLITTTTATATTATRTNAKVIGIGVGLGVAVPLFLAIGLLAGRRVRKGRVLQMVDEIRASELGGGREGERLELEGVEKCELQGQCRQELCGEEGGGMMVMEVMERVVRGRVRG